MPEFDLKLQAGQLKVGMWLRGGTGPCGYAEVVAIAPADPAWGPGNYLTVTVRDIADRDGRGRAERDWHYPSDYGVEVSPLDAI